MREKAKLDPCFRQRLLHYITSIVNECMSEEITTNDGEFNNRVEDKSFQPFLDPDDPNFDELMQLDLVDIVKSRQMHSRTHMPTCFKYRSKRCRSRFPQAIVDETSFDTEWRLARTREFNKTKVAILYSF